MKNYFHSLVVLLSVSATMLIAGPCFGQLLTSNYTFTPLSQSYVPVTGGTVHGTSTNDDQQFLNIPIGFFIAYNGSSYNTVGISANGYIWFGPSAPATTNYTPISSASVATAFVCAFARNLESRSAAGGGELRTRLTGTAPTRIFTIQWKNYQRFTTGVSDNGDIFNFQIRLHEYNQRIEIIYGVMSTNTSSTAQVGMRGSVNTNFMNRAVNATNIWNNSIAGTANTSIASYTPTRMPASGQTYRWTPTSLLGSSLAGGALDTVTNSMPQLVSGSTALTASFVEEGGITSIGIQRFINGVSQPWAAMTKLSGDAISGTWQTTLPDVNTNADVVYLHRIINPSGFFMYSGSIAYEVGYLRAYLPDDMLVDVSTQGSGINIPAAASISSIKITEVVLDRTVGGGSLTAPSYVPGSDIDLVELTNLSTEAVRMDGMQIRIMSDVSLHEFTFSAGTIIPGGGRLTVQAGGNSGQVATGNPTELYFETGGTSNMLQSGTAAGVALYNGHNDVLDAVAVNGYKFPVASSVRVVHWYGDLPSSAGNAGVRRTTMTDHNSSADWEFLNGTNQSGIGSMNPGLDATTIFPEYEWSSDDIPGWSSTGSFAQLPVLANGAYNIKTRVIDNGYFADAYTNVTMYTPAIPVADFTVSEVSVYQHQVVTLTDLSSDYPDNLLWNITPATFIFVNGTSSGSTAPQIQFNAPGTYAVTLTATNELGSSVITKSDYITVMPYLGVCKSPSQISVDNITTTSANVSWSEGFDADSMQIRYANVSGGGNGVQVYTGSSSVQLSGLTPSTNYYARVRSWCNGIASDAFTSKMYFTTNAARLAMYDNSTDSFNATLFPNPSNGNFQVDVKGGTGNKINLRIINISGQVIYTRSYILYADATLTPDIKLLPGIYFVAVSDGVAEEIMRLVIIE